MESATDVAERRVSGGVRIAKGLSYEGTTIMTILRVKKQVIQPKCELRRLIIINFNLATTVNSDPFVQLTLACGIMQLRCSATAAAQGRPLYILVVIV